MNVVSRKSWGAAPPNGYLVPVNWPVGVTLWIHHSEGPESATLRASEQIVRNIQAFHQGPQRGWVDIGYAYLVDSAGNVFEGRGEHVGAHSPGKNHEPSVCMLGNYDERVPTPNMHKAIYQLADWLQVGDFKGHRENTATDCPGDAGMRVVVNGKPPIGWGNDPAMPPEGTTLRGRVIASGYGPKSADVLMDRIARKQFGTVPLPTDSVRFRALRERGGLGPASARTVIAAGRYRP